MMLVLNLDFETTCDIDLTQVGAYKYCAHPSFDVLCAGFSIRQLPEPFDPSHVQPWRPWLSEEMPSALYDAFLNPETIIEAWNAQFERLCTLAFVKRQVAEASTDKVRQYWERLLAPIQVIERWHCTAARARAVALNGKLEYTARCLGIAQQKDMAGHKLMMKWCKPLPEGGYADDPAEYERLVAYCMQDVRTEGSIGMLVRDLTEEEWTDFAVNERINDRGIPVDVALARAAQYYAKEEAEDIRRELSKLTCGAIQTPKQYKKIKEWIWPRISEVVQQLLLDEATGKVSLDKYARAAILDDEDVRSGVSDDVVYLLELIDDAGRSSIAKFQSIERREVNGRIYGCYIFNGAGQTGRYSAVGFQPHNLLRSSLSNTEDVVEAIMSRASAEAVLLRAGTDEQGNPLNMLSTLARLMRPAVVAPQGKILVWSDYESVEARALPWLTRDPSADVLLDLFRKGGDVYVHAAADIYGIPVDQLLRDVKAKVPAALNMRQIGKVAVLSLGFGGGAGALRKMARNYGVKLDERTAEMIKSAWRRANPWAVKFWARLHKAACDAVRSPGVVYECGRVSYLMSGSTLWCLLPGGRIICYPEARVKAVDGKYGPQNVLTAIKGTWHPGADQKAWPRITLWHGILAENVTQGVCASFLRAALRTLDAWGWPVVMDTHDEALLEVFEDEADDAERALREAMTQSFEWSDGMPLGVATARGHVYGK